MMNKSTRFYLTPHVDAHGPGNDSHAGGMLPTWEANASGLI